MHSPKMSLRIGLLKIMLLSGITGFAIRNDHSLNKRFTEDPEPGQFIPTSDGLFHFYSLPIGLGDAHVIQCPNGDLTIVDMGSGEAAAAGFWGASEITYFLQGQYDRITNIHLTHNHFDHYSFIPTVLAGSMGMTGLKNIYVSCNETAMAEPIRNWLIDIEGRDKVRLFNNGLPCGPNGQPCGDFDLCPGDADVNVKVFAANLGTCSGGGQFGNVDSVVFKIIHNQVTILFTADFGDATSDPTEDGAQKSLVDFYGSEMEVTVYKIAHHGDQDVANKLVTCQAHRPKALFVSANPWFSNRYPRCAVFERFINDVGTLCRPEETDIESEFYCGEHPEAESPIDDRLQRVFTCGESSTDIGGGQRTISNNDLALYTTVPDQATLNIIKFTSDGVKWGFTNNIYPKIMRMHG